MPGNAADQTRLTSLLASMKLGTEFTRRHSCPETSRAWQASRGSVRASLSPL